MAWHGESSEVASGMAAYGMAAKCGSNGAGMAAAWHQALAASAWRKAWLITAWRISSGSGNSIWRMA